MKKINKEDVIELMNSDLKNEYTHHKFYLHSSIIVTGLERFLVKDWLKGQAMEEIGHVEQFAKKIFALGGMPITEAHSFPNLTDAKSIIKYAYNLECEVVKNYHERLEQISKFAEKQGKFYDLVLFYEEQLEESQTDIDEMTAIMQGFE